MASRAARRERFRRILAHASPVAWAYFDIILIALVTVLVYRTLVLGNPAYNWVSGSWANATAFCGGVALAGLIFGLYERQTLWDRSRILVRSMLALAVGLTLAYASITLVMRGETTRWLILGVGASYVGVAVTARLLAHAVITRVPANILCLGAGESIRRVVDLVQRGSRPHHRILGYLEPPGDAPPEAGCDPRSTRDCPRLGTLSELEETLKTYNIDEVVVDSALLAHPAMDAAILTCLDHRCRITDQPTFVETLLDEVPVDNIGGHWFLVADVQSSAGYEAVKSVVDAVAALIGLILTAPLCPLIALLIRLDSPGPIIHRQTRIGLRGRPFMIYKFRTMHAHAERDGARWAEQNDQRVTRVGRFLRKTRLDEIPQLWNILRGDMALVGPRPERPEFVEMLSDSIPHYRQRHLIKPGLTGWAQIRFGYGASVSDAHRKLCYDLYYLKHRSIDLDAAIIIRTIGRFLLGSR